MTKENIAPTPPVDTVPAEPVPAIVLPPLPEVQYLGYDTDDGRIYGYTADTTEDFARAAVLADRVSVADRGVRAVPGKRDGSWSVFNSGGACVIENVTFPIAADYMTADRFASGWTMVSVIKSPAELAEVESIAMPGDSAAVKPWRERLPCAFDEADAWDRLIAALAEINDWRSAAVTPMRQELRAAAKYDDVLIPFLAMMRAELHANASKGDRPGWLTMDRSTAVLEVYHHVAKLAKALRNDNVPLICEHAADVANMAMMVVDVCGALTLTTPIAPAAAAEPATGEDLAIYQSIADNYNADRERAASLVASEDTKRLDWLEGNACTSIFKIGNRWYTRAGYNEPHHRARNLREAIDRASAGEAQS